MTVERSAPCLVFKPSTVSRNSTQYTLKQRTTLVHSPPHRINTCFFYMPCLGWFVDGLHGSLLEVVTAAGCVAMRGSLVCVLVMVSETKGKDTDASRTSVTGVSSRFCCVHRFGPRATNLMPASHTHKAMQVCGPSRVRRGMRCRECCLVTLCCSPPGRVGESRGAAPWLSNRYQGHSCRYGGGPGSTQSEHLHMEALDKVSFSNVHGHPSQRGSPMSIKNSRRHN